MATTQHNYDVSVLSAECDYETFEKGSIIFAKDGKELEFVTAREDKFTGFKGVVYKDLSTDKYIVSFTGTQFTDLNDWIKDIQMLSGYVPGQFDKAKSFMKYVENELGITKDSIQSITGHSLGGALAEMIGALDEYSDIEVNTFNSYGVAHLLDNLKARGEELSNNFSNINNYGDCEDIVYKASKHIGVDHYINSDIYRT